MHNIILKELVGEFAIADGDKVYEVIYKHLQESTRQIVIDFDGVTVATCFLNASIGKLLQKYTVQDMLYRLQFKNTNQEMLQRIYRTMDYARQYYTSKEIRKVVKLFQESHND